MSFDPISFDKATKIEKKVEEHELLIGRNLISNGNFSNGSANWQPVHATATVSGGILSLVGTGDDAIPVLLEPTTKNRNIGHKLYYGAIMRVTNPDALSIAVRIEGHDRFVQLHPKQNMWYQVSGVYTVLSTGRFNIRQLYPSAAIANGKTLEIKNVVAIDLTAIFGAGNEPDKDTVETFLSELGDGWIDKATANILPYRNLANLFARELAKPLYDLEITAIADMSKTSIGDEKENYPTMFGVKYSNARTSATGYKTHPVPIGWLYYVDEEPYDILYADKSPENMQKLFTWNEAITWNGIATPGQYAPFITKDGDIIFVWRGEFAPNSVTARQNPIIYPAGDYDNPVVVDFGENLKPTSWLQNCGADYVYNQDCFVFGEYTRPVHANSYLWRVTKPYTDPNNWQTVTVYPVGDDEAGTIEHFHTVNYDTYTDRLYATTGDQDIQCKTLVSSDYGLTWSVVMEGNPKYNRVLNYVFTPDKIYWATDWGSTDFHWFFEASKDANGVLDPDSIKDLYNIRTASATYTVCLIDDPPGVLILDRYDGDTTNSLKILFWSFETNSMHTIKELYPLGGQARTTGFRCEAVSWYQSPVTDRIITGFGAFPNQNQLLTNVDGPNKDRVCNLALRVVRRK